MTINDSRRSVAESSNKKENESSFDYTFHDDLGEQYERDIIKCLSCGQCKKKDLFDWQTGFCDKCSKPRLEGLNNLNTSHSHYSANDTRQEALRESTAGAITGGRPNQLPIDCASTASYDNAVDDQLHIGFNEAAVPSKTVDSGDRHENDLQSEGESYGYASSFTAVQEREANQGNSSIHSDQRKLNQPEENNNIGILTVLQEQIHDSLTIAQFSKSAAKSLNIDPLHANLVSDFIVEEQQQVSQIQNLVPYQHQSIVGRQQRKTRKRQSNSIRNHWNSWFRRTRGAQTVPSRHMLLQDIVQGLVIDNENALETLRA